MGSVREGTHRFMRFECTLKTPIIPDDSAPPFISRASPKLSTAQRTLNSINVRDLVHI